MPFRDTFWNIPNWAEILLYVTQFLGVAILVGKLYLRRNMWYKGDGRLPFDHFGARLRRVWDYAVRQVRITRDRYAGIMHLAMFFSFIVLFIGTTLATIDYDIAVLIFDAKLLKGDFYLIYELVLDFFTLVAIFGIALAQSLSAGFVPVRKPGKLPWKKNSISYELEYGKDTVEIHQDAIDPGQRVILVDDLLATGGTMKACCELVRQMHANIVGITVLIELAFLNGRDVLRDYGNVHSVIKY